MIRQLRISLISKPSLETSSMHVSRIVGRVLRTGLVLAPMLLAGLVAPARADFVLQAPSIGPYTPGSSGFFDVILTDTPSAPTGPFDVAGFNVQLSIDPSSGITITGADIGVPGNYIFDGFTTFGFLVSPPPTGGVIGFNDATVNPTDFRTFNAGDSWVLGRVYFTVDPLATTPAEVPIVIDAGITTVTDPGGNPITFSPLNGSISLKSVPEPSSFVLAGLGAGFVGLALRRRKATASATV
jgi:hypothetical protein